MADVVQYRLERMANELDDLERRGLFTRREIAEIVKQCRKFEYRLKRPLPLKQDYIAYIDYEFRLDDLWRLHKKAAAREVTGEEEQTKPLVYQVISQVAFHKILTAYRKAKSMGCLSEELACDYISFCEQIGRFIEAKKLAEKFCGGNLSRSVRLWLLRVSLKVRPATRNSLSIGKDENQSIFELLKDILMKLPIAETESLRLLALKLFSNQRKYFEKLVEISLISVAKDGGSENGFFLPSAVVNFVLQKDGLPHARETYKQFLALPHPGLALYRNCIEFESYHASLSDKNSLANARKLYEAALSTYDQITSFWKDYHSMEMRLGTSETAAAVYRRARKVLKDSAVGFASTNQ